MKSTGLFVLFLSLFTIQFSYAEQLELFPENESAILCRGEVYVTSENLKVDAFADGCYPSDVLEGLVCFTGDEKWAAWAMNQSILWGDEEWVENAKVADKNTILMDFVDGPNDFREETSIPRCAN